MNSLKIISKFAVLLAVLFAVSVSATEDAGHIDQLYLNTNGSVGITLVEGYPNAVAEQNCGSNKKMGFKNVGNEHLVSALLAAKVANKTVNITTNGCYSNNWIEIIAVEFIE